MHLSSRYFHRNDQFGNGHQRFGNHELKRFLSNRDIDPTIVELAVMIGANRHYVRRRQRPHFFFGYWHHVMCLDIWLAVLFDKANWIVSEHFTDLTLKPVVALYRVTDRATFWRSFSTRRNH